MMARRKSLCDVAYRCVDANLFTHVYAKVRQVCGMTLTVGASIYS